MALASTSVYKNKYLANWFLKPQPILSLLGIKVKIQKYADWQLLKSYPFGDLGYDHEEGLRFNGDLSQLGELVKFIRTFHTDNKIPFTSTGKKKEVSYAFQINAQDSTDHSKLKTFARKEGLVVHKEFSHVFVLDDSTAALVIEEDPYLKGIMAKAVSDSAFRSEWVDKLFKGMEKVMSRLYSRWCEEKEYEDINDYARVVMKEIDKRILGTNFIAMTKRPFGFKFGFMGAEYHITINDKAYSYKQTAEVQWPLPDDPPGKPVVTAVSTPSVRIENPAVTALRERIQANKAASASCKKATAAIVKAAAAEPPHIFKKGEIVELNVPGKPRQQGKFIKYSPADPTMAFITDGNYLNLPPQKLEHLTSKETYYNVADQKCCYCGKLTTEFEARISHGACSRPKCVLRAMREEEPKHQNVVTRDIEKHHQQVLALQKKSAK